MRKSWLTAASVLAATAVEGQPAEAQNISISPSSMDFGNVRFGTSSAGQTLTVTNLTKLDSGSIGAPTAPFVGTGTGNLSDLTNKGTNKASFTFAPTASGGANQTINVLGTKGTTTTTLPLALSGVGVGPNYTSTPVSPLGTIDFGNVAPGGMVTEDLKITNSSTPISAALTDLTLLSANLSGTGSGFSTNFSKIALAGGNTFDLKIAFTAPTTTGTETETLAITTDQGAALGATGAAFDYTVTADVTTAPPAVPEPASLGLLATALAGFGAAFGWRRRKTGDDA